MKHWMIVASAGDFCAMHNLQMMFDVGCVSRESIDSTLTAYNNSCVEMRSEKQERSQHKRKRKRIYNDVC